MLKLYQFPAGWGTANLSPFSLKLEAYLRITQIPFEVVTLVDPRKGPKGKLPYIDDDGIIIADTSLIVAYLEQKYNITLDAHLTLQEKAISLGFQRLIEEHLFWCFAYARWIDDKNRPRLKQDLFKRIPFFIRPFVFHSIRKKIKRALYMQGLGRHSAAELYEFGKQDIIALANFLAEKKYLFGDAPTSLDASAYGLLANIIYNPIKSPLQDQALSCENLVRYCERIDILFLS